MVTPVFKKPKVSKVSDVSVSWAWQDESQGLITWTFKNDTDTQKSVVLYRNNYYFGNAFWCVYEANPEFGTVFATEETPLSAGGNPPLFVAEMDGKYIVCFLFTLAPNSEFTMTEGGFVDGMTPEGATLYDVTNMVTKKMCLGYDQSQVTQWNDQSTTKFSGYSPNPNTFNVVVGQVDAPYVSLYNDPIRDGDCTTTTHPTDCSVYEADIISALEKGEIMAVFEYVFKFLDCVEKNKAEQLKKFMSLLK